VATLQYRADSVPSSVQPRPATSRLPYLSLEIRSRLIADGSLSVRTVSECCHQSPSMRFRAPSDSIALRSFSLTVRMSAGVSASG